MNGDNVFDFERQLWDQIVLAGFQQGREMSDAISAADKAVAARRKLFNSTGASE